MSQYLIYSELHPFQIFHYSEKSNSATFQVAQSSWISLFLSHVIQTSKKFYCTTFLVYMRMSGKVLIKMRTNPEVCPSFELNLNFTPVLPVLVVTEEEILFTSVSISKARIAIVSEHNC